MNPPDVPPIVIAHRGASGYRPEHTLAAYALAIEQGADFIEPDLVLTRDGVLVARHENELSGSTDVGSHPEFAARRCRKRIDGVEREGWFSEDFLLAELRQLRARERLPALRPGNVAHDGQFPIPTLAEILALVRDAEAEGRRVGVYPEIKHPTWFAHEGRYQDGSPIGRSSAARLVQDLVQAGFTDPARVYVQCFEVAALLELRHGLMPAAGVAWPLVQLLGALSSPGPYDLAYHAGRGSDLAAIYGAGLPVPAHEAMPWRAFTTPDALQWLAGFVQVIGPCKDDLLLPDGRSGAPSWLSAALAAGLQVHPWTLRAELDGETELGRLLAMGVQGFFIDQPDLGVAVRARSGRG